MLIPRACPKLKPLVTIGVHLLWLVAVGHTLAEEAPKRIRIYHGVTPLVDGIVSPGEWDDAARIPWREWINQIGAQPVGGDLRVDVRIKHDGRDLFFAFEVADDVLYAYDTDRWLPGDRPTTHEISHRGLPWFGDGVEVFLCPSNRPDEAELGTPELWLITCSTHKSMRDTLRGGGLIGGEPKRPDAYALYEQWIMNGDMTADVSVKRERRPGFTIELKVDADPCLPVSPGAHWSPELGEVTMRLGFEANDLDLKPAGVDGTATFRHVMRWPSNWQQEPLGYLVIDPGPNPEAAAGE